MARSGMQKMKILLVMRELLEKTDEFHPITTTELVSMLERNGIAAERKSVYHDIEILKKFGIDIENRREQPSGYYVSSRDFEFPELKLLVDAVQCARFITRKKSEELIRKLEKLASKEEARQLQRQVFVLNRIKTKNENIYYSVDQIHTAIAQNAKIRFQYYEWTISKKIHLRKNGMFYEISPWALTWDDENYYMVGYDPQGKMIKHYRVDKMLKLQILRVPREGRELFSKFDIASYTQKMFGMFGGTEETVRLVCNNELIGVMIDRFGKEIPIYPQGENQFAIVVRVNVSQHFYGWLFALGNGVRIESPDRVVEQFKKHMWAIGQNYK